MKEIIDQISEAALLEQLAEECAELAQTSLKLSRIIRKENPTPVTEQDAYQNFVEEVGDVRLLLKIMDSSYDGIDTKESEQYKLQRWKKRIKTGDQRVLRL
jgi:hypothetical protein